MRSPQFGERPEFDGTPGKRTCGERRAFTANWEFTEFSFAVTTHHSESLEVEVVLLGDQPSNGFTAWPVYKETHPVPNRGHDPGPAYVLDLERRVMQSFAARLQRLLLAVEVDG